MERVLNFEFPAYLKKNQKLAVQTAPGIDRAISESKYFYLHKVPVNRYCTECSLRNECVLEVKVDKLANSIFVYGSCLKT